MIAKAAAPTANPRIGASRRIVRESAVPPRPSAATAAQIASAPNSGAGQWPWTRSCRLWIRR